MAKMGLGIWIFNRKCRPLFGFISALSFESVIDVALLSAECGTNRADPHLLKLMIMEKKFVFDYEHYDSIEQMPQADRLLIEEARKAVTTANATYSKFCVGAAARLRSGKYIYGSNFESEVYPAGLCAERSLLFHAFACHKDDVIEALAIASEPSLRECYPCGQCRQVLVDAERRQSSPIRIIMSGGGSASVVKSAELLLPFTFILK